MNNTRIRYSRQEDGNLISKQYFKIGDESYRILLYEKVFKFAILNSLGFPIFFGGNTQNLAVLRIQAKKALEDLGFKFEKEEREYAEDQTNGE